MKHHIDKFGTPVLEGDYVCYATTSQIWVGHVTSIPVYEYDHADDYVKIQIACEDGNGGTRKQTFDWVDEKIYRIGR